MTESTMLDVWDQLTAKEKEALVDGLNFVSADKFTVATLALTRIEKVVALFGATAMDQDFGLPKGDSNKLFNRLKALVPPSRRKHKNFGKIIR